MQWIPSVARKADGPYLVIFGPFELNYGEVHEADEDDRVNPHPVV